jgi:tRNA pseudouridine38-40 synthase
MHEATKHLTGTHDFGAFARSNTQTHTNICTVEHAYWEVWKTELIFHISANRFLRNMVRAITGTLVEVGLNKISPDEFLIIMNSKDRKKAGTSAPAKGLYLTRVTYPPQILKHV